MGQIFFTQNEEWENEEPENKWMGYFGHERVGIDVFRLGIPLTGLVAFLMGK